jgi:hypothetical protein
MDPLEFWPISVRCSVGMNHTYPKQLDTANWMICPVPDSQMLVEGDEVAMDANKERQC